MMPEGAIIGGFISKVINDVVDISRDKIKEADKSRKRKSYNIQCRIYQVIIDTINELTYNKYKGQDKLYDAAETLLKCFKSNEGDFIKSIKIGLSEIISQIDDEVCEKFVHLICREISKEEYDDLYKEIALLHDRRESLKTSRIEEKVDVVIQKIDDIGYNSEKVVSEQELDEKFQNNKKRDYIKIWNSRMFLHVDNDENPITLADAFIMPDYKMYSKIGRIKFSETDKLGDVIEKYVMYNRTSNMLIAGVPGIGKTSIVSWMANEFKYNEDVIILKFRDWEGEELREGLLKTICKTIKCDKIDLENKILILDGFDEMKSMNDRDSLLSDFLNDICDFYNFKIIITSRPNYIDLCKFQNTFELLTFNNEKVSQFYQLIKNQKLEKSKIDCNNLKVIGIPVILYMAIMCDINLAQKTTKPELYNRIFAKKGGIFDKFYCEGIGYDIGDQVLRNEKNANEYLKFLRKVAFKMFERNNLKLHKWECEIPKLNFHGDYIKIIEFPIKHIFESINENIEFIHKSIYEYFVSEYIYDSLYKGNNGSVANLMCNLGKLFKKNVVTHEILEFLKYKINNSELKNSYNNFYEAFEVMLYDGMIYYTRKCYKNCINCEMKVFANMLEILHLWENPILEFGRVITEYLKYNTRNSLNLRKVNMNQINLKGVDLQGANLQGANITDANLERANLCRANLEDAILIGVDLERADLQGANLVRADLRGANLKYAQLEASRWAQLDITKVFSQLKNTEFNYIVIEDQELRRVYRSELFDNEE